MAGRKPFQDASFDEKIIEIIRGNPGIDASGIGKKIGKTRRYVENRLIFISPKYHMVYQEEEEGLYYDERGEEG